MTGKITAIAAVLLNIAQVGFVVYFLAMYTTDNFPLFMFLFIVPLVNIFAIFFKK